MPMTMRCASRSFETMSANYWLRTPAEAEDAVFEFIEGWYNSHRRHSALNYVSPMEYELKHLGVTQDTSPDLSTETG
jgi:transposase InsO family protein